MWASFGLCRRKKSILNLFKGLSGLFVYSLKHLSLLMANRQAGWLAFPWQQNENNNNNTTAKQQQTKHCCLQHRKHQQQLWQHHLQLQHWMAQLWQANRQQQQHQFEQQQLQNIYDLANCTRLDLAKQKKEGKNNSSNNKTSWLKRM